MIQLLLIEDEEPAAEKMRQMVLQYNPAIQILAVLRSVRETLTWLESHAMPELILMDIGLSDGLSLDIFKQYSITCPVIFTTAYDEFLMEAFEYNSIDYLLKPIKQEKLENAFSKFLKFRNHFIANYQALTKFVENTPSARKQRLLVKRGLDFVSVKMEDIAYFFSEHKITFLVDAQGNKYIVDKPLADLEQELEPARFFRVSRKYLVQINAIKKFKPYHKGKLLVDLQPPVSEEVSVSQENASQFKQWITG